jgi:hypothetical protein
LNSDISPWRDLNISARVDAEKRREYIGNKIFIGKTILSIWHDRASWVIML